MRGKIMKVVLQKISPKQSSLRKMLIILLGLAGAASFGVLAETNVFDSVWMIEETESFTNLKKKAPQNVVDGLLWTETNKDSGYPLQKIIWFRSSGRSLLAVANYVESSLDWRFFDESGDNIGAISSAFQGSHWKGAICMGDLQGDGIPEFYGLGISEGGTFGVNPVGGNGVDSFPPKWLVESSTVKYSFTGLVGFSWGDEEARVTGLDESALSSIGVVEVRSDGLHRISSDLTKNLAKKSIMAGCYETFIAFLSK